MKVYFRKQLLASLVPVLTLTSMPIDHAQAVTYRYDISGYIDHMFDSADLLTDVDIMPGSSTFTGSFTYDPTPTGSYQFDDDYMQYYLEGSFSLSIDDRYEFSIDSESSYRLHADVINDRWDRDTFSYGAHGVGDTDGWGLPQGDSHSHINLWFKDSSSSVFSGVSLPQNINLSDYDSPEIIIHSYNEDFTVNGYYGIVGVVTSLEETIISEEEINNYGLFIGVRDSGATDTNVDARGDLAALSLADTFNSLPNSVAYSLTADLTMGESISTSSIENRINEIYEMMDPDDNLVLYITGHGASELDVASYFTTPPDISPTAGLGDEYIRLGGLSTLSDDDLTSYLRPLSDINIWTFIDACHAGGFWVGGASEGFDQDLSGLDSVALLASASEEGYSWYEGDGLGIISRALNQAWLLNPDGYYNADFDASGDMSFEEISDFVVRWVTETYVEYPGEFVYQMGLGDAVPFSPELVYPVAYKTDGFSSTLVVRADVSEPISIALMGLGLAGIGFARKKKHN